MARKVQGLRKAFAGFMRTMTAMFDSYHPERHYMRGPGPKWHAKHPGF
jgi:hypothetical protein